MPSRPAARQEQAEEQLNKKNGEAAVAERLRFSQYRRLFKRWVAFAREKGDGIESTAEFLRELSPEEHELALEYSYFFSYGQSGEELKKRIDLLRENVGEFIAYLPALKQLQSEVEEESEREKHKGSALALIHDSETSDVLSKLSRHETSIRNAIARDLNQLFLLQESRLRAQSQAESVAY